ncbi:MAG: hypothetical protein KF809_04020 [Chloroflexi bacterium]|nr:hypothetical protein [Chloroflexota bacterium]
MAADTLGEALDLVVPSLPPTDTVTDTQRDPAPTVPLLAVGLAMLSAIATWR